MCNKVVKKLLPIIFFIFLVLALRLAGLSFSPVKTRAEELETPKSVSLTEFYFYNALSEDSYNVTMGKAKFGMLLRFDDVLSDNRSEVNGGIKTVNLVDKYAKNIFINDMPLDFYVGAEVYYFYEEYMWVYIPNMNAYRKLSVNEAFQFQDRMIEPFTLYTALSQESYSYGYPIWTLDGQAYADTKTHEVELKKIEFNNTGYKYFSPKKGLLLEFDAKNENGDWLNKDISSTPTEKDGGLMRINLVHHNAIQNTFLGAHASVDSRILLDGIPFKDIPGAEITYHSQRYVWLYAPNMIDYTKLEIMEDTLFLDAYLPKVELYSNGDEWVDYDPTAARADIAEVSYIGIEWNNYDFGHMGGKNGVLLEFSDNLSKYAKEIAGGARSVNKVNTAIGAHVCLNGTPLKNINGAQISYYSEKLLWIYIPSEELIFSGGNAPCLTIDKGAEFLNAKLPAVTIYFDGSYWQDNMPNFTEYEANAFMDIKYNNVTVSGNEGYAYTIFTFADEFAFDELSIPNLAQIGDAGQKIRVNGKTLKELYQEDNKTYCSLVEGYGKNTLQVLLRKSDLFPTVAGTTTTLTIEDGTKFMDKTLEGLTFYLVDGKWSVINEDSMHDVEDKQAPYIYYYGEAQYQVFVGEEIINFSSMAFAFDEYEGGVECKIEFPDGAITDNKWNRGEWQVKLVATDAQGNKSEKEIFVTAIHREEQYLSVYVNGFFSYRLCYGEKIQYEKSEELLRGAPEKADTESSYFVFVGWTYQDKFWDFENDVATEDVWLSPIYKEYKRPFTLTIKDVDSDTVDFVTVKYGDIIDFSQYKKDGYKLTVKVDDTIVKRVTVSGNVSVELQYTPISTNEDNGATQAILILVACWVGASLLTMASVILYKKLGKKTGGEQ